MDTETSLAPGHSAAHALTDITLGILQDSGALQLVVLR